MINDKILVVERSMMTFLIPPLPTPIDNIYDPAYHTGDGLIMIP